MQSSNRRENKNATEHQEIDLFDLSIQLWKGKRIILTSMLFALVIVITYLIFHKPTWVSTAVVAEPNAGQIADYTNTMLALYSSSVKNDDAEKSFVPSVADIRAGAFGRFSALLSARISQEPYKKMIRSETLKMLSPGAPIQLTYSADSREEPEHELRSLLAQINHDVEQQLTADLQTNLALRKQELTSSLAIQEKLAKEQRAQRRGELEQTIQTTAAKGDAVSVVIKDDSGRQLNYDDEYLKTQERLMKLASIEPAKMKIGTFYYVVEPGEATEDKKAPDALLVALALILGGIIGACIVLTKNAIRHYQ